MILEYERRMLEDTKNQSFLMITSYGLNLSNIIKSTIASYLNKYCLVFLLNFEESSLSLFSGEEYFRNIQLCDKSTRNKLYKKCGVFFSSPRMIITDFLEANLDITKVSCIIVNDADNIKDRSLEAFILYFYSKNCPEYSIKAFSSNCISFSSGPNSLEKKVESLRTTNIILYPRFHETVKLSFINDIKYSEHKLKMNNEYVELQMILIEMLKEICKPLTKKYGHSYEFILISNQFSVFEDLRNTTLLYDIKDLKFLIGLIQSASHFLLYYESSKLIKKQIELGRQSTWINCTSSCLFIEALEKFYCKIKETLNISEAAIDIKSLFKEHEIYKRKIKNNDLKELVFDVPKNRMETHQEDFDFSNFYGNNTVEISNKKESLDQMYSFCNKKFLRLVEFIKVNQERSILVVCNRHLIKRDIMFQMKAMRVDITKVDFYSQKEFLELSYWSEGFRKLINNSRSNDLRNLISDSKNINEAFDMCEELSDQSIKETKRIKSCFEDVSGDKLDMKVILYDLNIEVLRYCEYLGNIRNITVDALVFKDSIEEERFLTSIRREKVYFEQLIEKRAKLPIMLDDNCDVFDDEHSYEEEENYNIVVDTRELRAELVFMLYKTGNKLLISTLLIGDYLLSEEICIERKNISDLISSFNSGRLYSQTVNLSHSYTNPFILIEFMSRPCLSDYCNIGTEGFKNSLVSKLTIFLINFPTVRLIWSSSALFSVRAIRILQKKTPNAVSDQSGDINPTLLEILLSIPGITQFNIKKVCSNFRNLKALIMSSSHTLVSVLGDKNGIKVYDFFNQKIQKKSE